MIWTITAGVTYDPLSVFAVALARTTRIVVGTAIIQGFPRHPVALAMQALALEGFLLAARNQMTDAISSFDRALALDGRLGNAWLGRGLCQIRRGDVEAGGRDLLIAAAVEPRRSLLRSYLGKALSDAGEAELARHELDWDLQVAKAGISVNP